MNYGHEDRVMNESNGLMKINLHGYDVLIWKSKTDDIYFSFE